VGGCANSANSQTGVLVLAVTLARSFIRSLTAFVRWFVGSFVRSFALLSTVRQVVAQLAVELSCLSVVVVVSSCDVRRVSFQSPSFLRSPTITNNNATTQQRTTFVDLVDLVGGCCSCCCRRRRCRRRCWECQNVASNTNVEVRRWPYIDWSVVVVAAMRCEL